MGAMAPQITSLTIVYLTFYWDADRRKHQSSASLVFEWGIHREPVNSPHKWPAWRNMFPFDDVIMVITSQITGISHICSIICSGADQGKHQSSALLAFVRGIHQSPGGFPSQRTCNVENVSIWWSSSWPHPTVLTADISKLTNNGDIWVCFFFFGQFKILPICSSFVTAVLSGISSYFVIYNHRMKLGKWLAA